MKKTISIILMVFLLMNSVFAGSISIDSVETFPSKISLGDTASVRINLENQGEKDLKNIKVSLELTSESIPFAPVGSAAQKMIDEIEEDEDDSVTFNLAVLPDAKPNIYKIPVSIEYEEDDKDIMENSVISLEIDAEPILDVALEDTEVYMVGQRGEIIVRFVNKGLNDIKFLSADLQPSPSYDIVSSSSYYIGNIEPDDFETAEFTVYVKEKSCCFPITAEFRDSDNEIYKQTYNLQSQFYSQEEALQAGLIQPSQVPLYATVIAVLIILIVLWRAWRKSKKNNK